MRIECINTPSLTSDITLHYCGYEDCSSNFFCGSHVRDCYLIHYITKGEGVFLINGKEYSVNEQDIFTIFPGYVVNYYTKPENPWSFCWFAFSGKKAPELLNLAGVTLSQPVLHIESEYSISHFINKCIDELKKESKPLDAKLQGYLYLILSNLQESYMSKNPSAISIDKPSEYIEKALLFIEYNYMKPITIKDISSYIGLDRTYFSKVFKKHMGISPQDYMIKYRIEKSIQLMKTTNLNFKQICVCVGIPEEYYFSRLFKSITGVSPSKYRNNPKKIYL